MRHYRYIIVTISLLAMIGVACARQPREEKAVAIMNNYFKHYAKKYPDSILGKYGVNSLKLDGIEEIHKGLVAAVGVLELADGNRLVVKCNLQRKALGWKMVSWENLGIRQSK